MTSDSPRVERLKPASLAGRAAWATCGNVRLIYARVSDGKTNER